MTKREQYGRVASGLQTLVHVIVSGRFANPLAFVEYPFLESDRSTGAHEVSLKALRQKYRGTNTGFFVSMSEDANRVVVPTQAQLTFIQVVFKLSNSQLARILDVKRATVVRWQGEDEETLPTILDVNRDRIDSLFRAAQIWCEMLGDNRVEIGRLFSLRVLDGQSALDILSAKPIDWRKLQTAYRALRTLLGGRKVRRSRRASGLKLAAYSQIPQGDETEFTLIEQHECIVRELREPWRRGVVGS